MSLYATSPVMALELVRVGLQIPEGQPKGPLAIPTKMPVIADPEWREALQQRRALDHIPAGEVEEAFLHASRIRAASGVLLLHDTRTIGDHEWQEREHPFALRAITKLAGAYHSLRNNNGFVPSPKDFVRYAGGEYLVSAALLQWPIGGRRERDPAIYMHAGEIAKLRWQFPEQILAINRFRRGLQCIALRKRLPEKLMNLLVEEPSRYPDDIRVSDLRARFDGV